MYIHTYIHTTGFVFLSGSIYNARVTVIGEATQAIILHLGVRRIIASCYSYDMQYFKLFVCCY